MKKLFIVVISILLMTNLQAQNIFSHINSEEGITNNNSKWFFENPQTTSNNINTAFQVNDSLIIFGADAGTILFFNNTESSVRTKIINSNYDIKRIRFWDSMVGYCLTSENISPGENQILKTTDGGKNWEKILSGYGYNDFCIVDSLTIIVVGGDSTITISNSGGRNWTTKTILPHNSYLNVIKKTPNNVLYAAGNVLIRSFDKGKTWSLVKNVNLSFSVNNIEFDSFANVIYMSGDNKIIKYFLSDSISQVILPDISPFYIAKTLILNNGIYCIAQYYAGPSDYLSRIKKYNSSNNTWDLISNYDFFINNIIAISDSTFLFYGQTGRIGIINIKNGKYQLIDNNDIKSNIVAIKFINQKTGWALSSKGEVLKSTDSGDSWTLVFKADSNNIYWYMDFLDENDGWISCGVYANLNGGNNHLMVLKTTDGGVHWKQINTDYSFNYGEGYKSMYFLNKDIGCIAKDPDYILKTTDGGSTWKNYGIKNFFYSGQSIDQIQFINQNVGYAVGKYIKTLNSVGSPVPKAIVLKTTDGGLTWNIIYNSNDINPGTDYMDYFNSLTFWDEEHGVVSGSKILTTEDGGLTWNSVGDYFWSNRSYFANIDTGWAINNVGTIYKTTDGGNSWGNFNLTRQNLSDLSALNDSLCWFAGNSGTIIRYGIPKSSNSSISTESVSIASLFQNYPNPFNPSTRIEYSIPHTENVTLKIYDILGRLVTTLVNGEKPAGKYTVGFNGGNLSSGVYFYQIKAGSYIKTKKMLLLK